MVVGAKPAPPPPEAAREERAWENEKAALIAILDALRPLDGKTRTRILNYVGAKFDTSGEDD